MFVSKQLQQRPPSNTYFSDSQRYTFIQDCHKKGNSAPLKVGELTKLIRSAAESIHNKDIKRRKLTICAAKTAK